MICRAFSAPRYDSWNFPSSEGLARFSQIAPIKTGSK